MADRVTSALGPAALVGGFLCAVSLVLPWFEISGRARSSIDLIASASALDVIEGWQRLAVVGLWLVVPLLVAAALLAFVAGRRRSALAVVAAVGLAILAVVAVAATIDVIGLAWGAWLAGGFGAATVVCAIMELGRRQATEGSA